MEYSTLSFAKRKTIPLKKARQHNFILKQCGTNDGKHTNTAQFADQDMNMLHFCEEARQAANDSYMQLLRDLDSAWCEIAVWLAEGINAIQV